MHADSFLGALATVRAVVSHTRSERALCADEAIPRSVDEAHGAVCDLADLCVAGMPLPSLDRRPPEAADAEIASVLEARLDELVDDFTSARCDGGQSDDHPLADRASVESPVTEDVECVMTSYGAVDRSHAVDGHRVIPLPRTGPAAANWYVLCDVLASVSASVAADCRTLVDRHQLAGNGHAADAWAGVADLLSSVASFADYHVAVARWVRVPGRETVARAERTRTLAERLGAETPRKHD